MSPSPVAWAFARQAADGDERRIVVEGTDLVVYNTPQQAERRKVELGRFTKSRFQSRTRRVGSK